MIRQYRKQWLRWHNGYERMARIIFQRTFKEIAKDIPFDRMTVGTYKSYLQTHVSKEKIFESYVKVYSEVGTKHGKRVGVQINKQINEKNFNIDGFLNEFQRTLTNFLVNNEGSRITTVRQSYIKFLTQIMSKGIADGKTISMISTDMTKLIKSRNFYRWQALRIARTETTAASNYAATVSSSVSGVLMDKVWISALDERTRQGKFNHLEMNQKRVPLDKPFNVSGEKLMFPGDPKGSGGNVINCRCSVAQVVRRDADGNIMRIADKVPVRDINSTINTVRVAKTLKQAIINEKEFLKTITKKEYNALTEYTNSTYIELNGFLRGRKGFSQLGNDKSFINLLNTIDKTLEKSPKFETLTYRFISFDDRDKFKSFISNIKTNGTFTERGFMSTSTEDLSRFMDGKYRIKIEIEGKNGRLLKESSINPDENEVLFRKGTSFNIEDFKKMYDDEWEDNAEYILKLKEI